MSITSPEFFIGVSISTLLVFLLNKSEWRRATLLIVSYLFYVSLSHMYIVVLIIVTALAFFGGLALRSPSIPQREAIRFSLLLTLTLSPLFIFKYTDFFLRSFVDIASIFRPTNFDIPALALPIGISFFTFVAVGYLIDVYLEIIEPEEDPVRFALFLSFFPLVTAGPIERASHCLPQLELNKKFSADNTLAAFRLIFWGLILKLVFADFLQLPLGSFFDAPQNYTALDHVWAMFHYTLTLYADFAGYSLIAIGSARMFGIDVLTNFAQPLFSATVPEFWRRWHISLSSWVRDYVFSPMNVRWRRKKWGMVTALLCSFVILGFWHGAGWGFLAFGAIHGMYVSISLLTLKHRDAFWRRVGMPTKLLHVLRVTITFLLVLLSFVVFRANSMNDAMTIYSKIFSTGLFRDAGLAISSIVSSGGKIPSLRFSTNYYDGWLLCLALLIGDCLVRNRWPLERFPKIVQVVIYNLGVSVILYKWLGGYVAAPFQYYKF